MESTLNFVSIIIIVFGILQIILFFKLWGMTNDVSKIRDLLESKSIKAQVTKDCPDTNSQESNIEAPNDISVGDEVVRLSDRKRMIVDSIENGKCFCKASAIEGYRYFGRDEIEPLNK